MILSTKQKLQTMEALLIFKKEVEFQQMTVKEQQELHKIYNEIKESHIPLFYDFLYDYADEIYEELEDKFENWARQKKEQFNQAADEDYNYNFDFVDLLFLLGLIPAINRVTGNIPIANIESYVKVAYEDSSIHYQKLELDKIEAETGTRIQPAYKPQYYPNNPQIYNQFKDYTLKSIKTVGEKYRPVLEKIIREGYKNRESIDTIAKKMQKAVDPTNNSNKVSHIFKRIASTEIASYTEMGKRAAFESLGINKKQFISRRDSHVCPRCVGFDGIILNLTDDSIWIPVHPHCRCCWIPIYDSSILVLPFLVAPLLIGSDEET